LLKCLITESFFPILAVIIIAISILVDNQGVQLANVIMGIKLMALIEPAVS